MNIVFSPDVILCGWLGSKYQLTNQSLFIFKAQKQEHIKPLLQKFHWLPVHSRIQYKIPTLCYSSFSETYPLLVWTFDCLLSIQTTSFYPRHKNLLHSSHKNKNIWRTFGERAFSFTGLKQWNSVPHDVHHSPSLFSFKKAVKTYHLESAYEWTYPSPTWVCMLMGWCVCVHVNVRAYICVCLCTFFH